VKNNIIGQQQEEKSSWAQIGASIFRRKIFLVKQKKEKRVEKRSSAQLTLTVPTMFGCSAQ
jgi:hypothetical protein